MVSAREEPNKGVTVPTSIENWGGKIPQEKKESSLPTSSSSTYGADSSLEKELATEAVLSKGGSVEHPAEHLATWGEKHLKDFADKEQGDDRPPMSAEEQLPPSKLDQASDRYIGSRDDGPEPPFFATLFLAINILQDRKERNGLLRKMLYGELNAITQKMLEHGAQRDFKIALVDYFPGQNQENFCAEIVGLGNLYHHDNLVLHFIAHGKPHDAGMSRGHALETLTEERLREVAQKVHDKLKEKMLMFFNVCHSDALAYAVSDPISDIVATIGFKGRLPEPLAQAFSSCFYTKVFVDRASVKDSFEEAKEETKKKKKECSQRPRPRNCEGCNPDNYCRYGTDTIWGWKLPEIAALMYADNHNYEEDVIDARKIPVLTPIHLDNDKHHIANKCAPHLATLEVGDGKND